MQAMRSVRRGRRADLLFRSFTQGFAWLVLLVLAVLPQGLFNFALGPHDNWHRLAWAAALISTPFVLLLMITARVATGRKHRT